MTAVEPQAAFERALYEPVALGGAMPGVTLVDLVAHVTSHAVLDYDLLTDLFLTYRLFSDPHQLLDLLLTRLDWALTYHHGNSGLNEIGHDVIVRTFVVLRHWVLNFFGDDFVADRALRVRFATRLSAAIDSVPAQSDERIGRVLDQLARAWIKQCCLYWDMPAMVDKPGPSPVPLPAGGPVGRARTSVGSVSRLPRFSTLSVAVTGVSTGVRGSISLSRWVPSGEPPHKPNTPGSLIRGGISLSHNVEVLTAPQSSADPAPGSAPGPKASTGTLRPKRTLRQKLSVRSLKSSSGVPTDKPHGRFFAAAARALGVGDKSDRPKPTATPTPMPHASTNQDPGPRIDILSARVIEELDRLLKAHPEPVPEPEPEFEPEPDRQSVLDTLGVQDRIHTLSRLAPVAKVPSVLDLTSNPLDWVQHVDNYDSDFFVDSDDMSARRSYMSYSSSASYVSYSSDLSSARASTGSVPNFSNPMRNGLALRRKLELSSLRPGRTIDSVFSQLSGGSARDFASRQSSSHLKAAAAQVMGLDPEMAAQLAAIPDYQDGDGDALQVALAKLEGTYQRGEDDDYDGDSLLNTPRLVVTDRLSEELYDQGMGLKHEPRSEDTITELVTKEPDSVEEGVDSDSLSGNHTPFLLDYTVEELATQLTAIERDALGQVDWKELIELGWNGAEIEPIQSWLSFLVERRSRGIEVVVSRFNIAVNWFKSEVLLTRSLEQRVQTVVKLIHVANYCHSVLHNYSTPMQIVLALDSDLIQRMSATWAGIQLLDRQTLVALQELFSPLRNFNNLRNELRLANLARGCVPFVGIYLSDLVANDEKPSFYEGGRINLSKFRTAASIVKSLIQCVDWSANYRLDAADQRRRDLLSKCLYIHCLTVEEMEACARHTA